MASPQRPDFTKANIIKDPSMMDAFNEGLTEGLAHRGVQIIYKVTTSFEGIKLNEKIFEKQSDAIAFVIDNTTTVGQEAHIVVQWVTAPAGEEADSAPALEAGDDDIVDAEVVEEN